MSRDVYKMKAKLLSKMISAWVIMGLLVLPVFAQNTQQLQTDRQVIASVTDLYGNVNISGEGVASAVLNKIITLELRRATLEEALQEIARQAGLKLSYSTYVVPTDKRLRMSLSQVTVTKALWEVLKGTGLRFAVSPNRHLVVMKKKKMELRAAQETVRGQVTDANTGETLPGVNIAVKGTTTGTSTDSDGRYELNVSSLSDTLLFSFVGYQTREVPINGRTEIDVALQSQAISGDEVVVIGYGEQRRRDLTGAIASVDATQFEGESISSFEQGLQGKAAGVNVTTSSGRPGGEMIVRIRGSNSILGGNDPLYVIDGTPVQSGTSGGTSMLAMLNPGNIESIDILKDASATAIYGSRGSNGVIIITTKQGRSGSHLIEFESSIGFQQVEQQMDMVNSRQFLEIANERATNDGGSPIFDDAEIESLSQINTNWQDEVFRNGATQNYTLTFSGGDETTQYAVTGNYYDQEGIIRSTDFLRGSIRVNLDQEISPRLNVSTRSYLSRSESNAIPEQLLILSALQSPPFMTVFDEDGNYTSAPTLKQYSFSPSTGENPVALAEEQLNRRIMDRILANISTDYDLNDNFTLKVLFGIDHHTADQNNYNPRILDIGLPAGEGSRGISRNSLFLNENTLTFQSELRENDRINITSGFTWQRDKSTFLSGSASGFVNDELQNNVLGSGENFSAPNTSVSEAILISGLTRINYVMNDKYLFTMSGRYDGSSRFGAGNKWGFFPSGAFSWILSEENFIRQNFENISELKLRLSYGVSGNQAISPYESLQRFSSTSLSFGGSPSTGFIPANLGNPDLKWESTEEVNVGIELGLWDQRLRINTDYYVKNTSDLLALVNLPPTAGFNTTFQNVGSTKNRGIEFNVDASLLRGNISWNMGFNVSSNQNTVTETSEGQDIIAPTVNILGSANIIREGEPLGAFFGLETDGLTEDGFFNFVDQNGDDEISDADRVILGDPYADFTYGLTTNFSYRNLHIRASLVGEYGKDIWNMNKYRFMSSMHRGQAPIADVANNRWTPDNPDPNAPYPRATSVLNQSPSDWYIEDASYLRLQNLQVTYNLPQTLINTLRIRNASLSLTGQNLITFTDYSWFTPDINTFGSGDLRIGVDHRSYPTARTLSFGVRVGL